MTTRSRWWSRTTVPPPHRHSAGLDLPVRSCASVTRVFGPPRPATWVRRRPAAEWLLFLEGDTLPAAGYCPAMVGRLRADRRRPWRVGRGPTSACRFRRRRRRVVLLASFADRAAGPDRGGASAIQVLDEPQWLSTGTAHRQSRCGGRRGFPVGDLRGARRGSRGCGRRPADSTRTFVGYGGEDWDFGWRAWLAGAPCAHEPAAVAWHDGPDAAGRDLDPATKNAECLRPRRPSRCRRCAEPVWFWSNRRSSSGISARRPVRRPMPPWSPASAGCSTESTRPCGFRVRPDPDAAAPALPPLLRRGPEGARR